MSSKSNTRALNIDRTKDYTLPLQVETSVEYDLPSHIYPPKGSEPILMIHPAYTTPVRAKKVAVTSHSPSIPSSSNSLRPLAALQVHASLQPQQQQATRSASKSTQSKSWCSCGNPNCNSSSSRAVSVRSSQQQTSVLSSRQVSQIPENILYSAVKSNIQSTELKPQQKQLQQQDIVQIRKQIQAQQQKQIQLQQQQQLQQQLQERAKLQAQQIQHLQAQQQKSQQQSQQTTSLPRQQTTSDQLISWGVGGRCQGPCCQPRIAALPPSQAEFLAPGLPPSLLARTPTRGPAGGSPKLRARTRRGLSVANTVNLPEYLGSTRSSRTNSVGGLIGGSSHAHSRTRSSSMLAATPAPITAHQVASALDVVRAQVLTPRSLFASTQQHQKQLQTSLNNTTSLLSTVGQSRDSGCSLTTEVNTTSANTFASADTNSAKNVEYSWSLVDSGFCTPVETNEDQVMGRYNFILVLGNF